MKRFLSVLLVCIMLISIFPISVLAANPFTDVLTTDYFYEPVLWAFSQGITTGMTDTTFAPEATCTRGQIVTFLWRSQGSPDAQAANNPFRDVNSGDYFYEAVLWAVENKITSGMSADTFAPNDPCTRGQVATFLWRSQGQPTAATDNSFADVAVGAYYYDAVLWAVEKGVTNGVGPGSFAPDAPCTRGQIVTFLHRANGSAPVYEELQVEDLDMVLKIPTIGYLNGYAYVEVRNHTDLPITIPSMGGFNGKLCSSDGDYVLDGGSQVKLTYYRAILESERYKDKWKDMYLDNNSLAYLVIEWNADQYYCEFGVDGIVNFYRGNVNGPATDPVGPDQPSVPEVPDVPQEPEENEVIYYTMHPAVPDLGAMFDAELAMGGQAGDDTYYYWGSVVWSVDVEHYEGLLESCGFVYKDTVFGTILDRDYDIFEHSTLDITVEVGFWRDNPLGNLVFVTVTGEDAGKGAPNDSDDSSEDMEEIPAAQGYEACPAVPDFGAFVGVEPEFGSAGETSLNYSYLSSKVMNAAGPNAVANYLKLLESAGFVKRGGYSENGTDCVIYVSDALDLTVSVSTTFISLEKEYISISVYGDGYGA